LKTDHTLYILQTHLYKEKGKKEVKEKTMKRRKEKEKKKGWENKSPASSQ
jgi:hypothetical protein